MAYRYAVLWEHEGEQSRPVGLAVEREGHVFVDVRDELAIPQVWSDPFIVGSVRSPVAVTYRPGDAQYFDHVLLDLSRTFSIGEQAMIGSATDAAILDLLRTKVLTPLRACQAVPYAVAKDAHKYTSVKNYRRKYYTEGATEHRDDEPPEPASSSSLVAA